MGKTRRIRQEEEGERRRRREGGKRETKTRWMRARQNAVDQIVCSDSLGICVSERAHR